MKHAAVAVLFSTVIWGASIAQAQEAPVTEVETVAAQPLPGGPEARQIFDGSLKTSEAVKKHGFLKEYMRGIAGNQVWATGGFKTGKTEFLFFYLSSESEEGDCGFLGCPFTVWANEGKGYFQVMDILNKFTNTVTYVQKDEQVTLYFCDIARGLSTWKYENSHFVHKKADEQTPECNIKVMQDLSPPVFSPEEAVTPAGTE